MGLVDAAIAHPRTAVTLAAAAAASVVGGFVAVGAAGEDATLPAPVVRAHEERPGTVPTADRPVTARLSELAETLRSDPTLALPSVSGIVARHVRTGPGTVGGEFALRGASGACYVVTFAADRSWLVSGDTSGLDVSGPQPGDDAACDLDA